MYVIRQGIRVSVSTPAKLNLFLELTGRRPDGFHELDTLMTPVDLFDQLSVQARSDDAIYLSCHWSAGQSEWISGKLPATEDNIVYKAVSLLQSRSGAKQGADIRLQKRIPSQAGLGGGSSDAMAALVAANRVWKLGWRREQLAELGAELGSDTPFFMYGGLARCTGRGEKIQTLQTHGRMHFVVVKPKIGLSTPNVFGHATVPASPVSIQPLLAAAETMNLRDIGKSFFNRLQLAAQSMTSWIAEIAKVMDGFSVLGHQMSGSGSSYFALCRNKRHARLLAARLRATRLGQVFVATSLGLSPTL